MKKYALLCVAALNTANAAEPPRPIPTELFGLKLGQAYDLGDERRGQKGDIPVKRFAGIVNFLGEGISYYFEPKKTNKLFPYVETKKSKADKYFETSFRAYLLPIIPDTLTSVDQLTQSNLQWQPIVIEWSIKAKSKKDSYYWAMDLCKTFTVDFEKTPEIYDVNEVDSQGYSCTFGADDREFTIAGMYGFNRIKLEYNTETVKAMNTAVETKRRKIAAKSIIPE